ncbi:GNAT family N-acetyltransferase [Actinophytocola xanthii]|uniref:GNAT family N-acetyltransferase n=1 Tax=Actinophytocola xanthii TaxID=1912961 RepID=A0A1Q8CM13_9PSEU|nr:GNAT family N-acetyltransferase [Actinophytocola xanthii]
MREFRAGDTAEAYAVCLRTGDSGEDASALHTDPDLLGHVYVGAYLALAPSLAFVCVDDTGVAGYVVGASDTRAFEQACERDWWPGLRRRYPPHSFPAHTPDGRVLRLIHEPPEADADVVERYPAHLHINLMPRLQGLGMGRRLLETLFDALRAAGAPAIHLGVSAVNHRAIGFYHRMGFTEVRRHTTSLILARPL